MIYIIFVLSGLIFIWLISLIVRKLRFRDENKATDKYWREQNQWLIDEFSRCNVIVFGKKGSGKDVTFNHVINLRGLPHYSNMPYNHLTTVADLTSLSVGDNTYEAFLEGTINKFDPVFTDCLDYYISDAGVYLPSQYDKNLDKLYPSMPLFYALSRQLHQMNVHANVQALGRLYKKLREHADSFLWVRKTVDCGDYLVVHAISYDRYESAERRLLPTKDKQYGATYGDIQPHKFKIYKKDLQFDTYYFRKVLLNAADFISPRDKEGMNLKELLNSGYKIDFR